jgi:hypothetical protein
MATPISDFKSAGIARDVMTGAGADLVEVTDPELNRVRLESLVLFGYLTPEQAHALLEAIVNGGTTNGLEPLPSPKDLRLPLYNLIRGSLASKSDGIDVVGEVIAIAQGVEYIIDHWDEISDAASAVWDFLFG